MQRFIDNMGKLGMIFADREMEPLKSADMERRDRGELRRALASMPHKEKLLRDEHSGVMINDIAYAAAEAALTSFSERIASAPLTLSERNVAGALVLLPILAHLEAVRDGMVANVAILAGLNGVEDLGLDGTESIEQLLAKLGVLK
jgi:hypothetical protein